MEINLAKSAGFCFGVKRALKIALLMANKGNVYMLGDIVHNEAVVKLIRKTGIKKIKQLSSGRNKVLLIRAHGASLSTVRLAERLGYKVVDATCPMVKEIHKKARGMEKKGFRIIVIGDKLHDEVRGIIGQLNTRALVIDDIKNIPVSAVRNIKRACVVVQSTQNFEKVLGIVNALKGYIRHLEFINTICMPTRIKQEEIKRMSLENDAVMIIGSKTSANARRLYEISRGLNRKTFWVNSKKEIKPQWFKGIKTIGVTAGASTPDSATRDIISHIKRITKN